MKTQMKHLQEEKQPKNHMVIMLESGPRCLHLLEKHGRPYRQENVGMLPNPIPIPTS